jgi:hypothetical protein
MNGTRRGRLAAEELSTDSMQQADSAGKNLGPIMKTRLLTALFAAAALSGCATYDYAGGSAPGGYYHGRPSVEYYGPYGGSYGYGSYGYGGYGYSPYGYYGGYYPGGGYYPYYPHRPHRPHHPRPDHDNDRPPPSQGGRAPPWRHPDGRYQDSGQVMVPPRNGIRPAPSQPQVRNEGRGDGIRVRPEGGNQQPRMVSPSQPRPVAQPRPMERSRPVERPQSLPRASGQSRVRDVEE